MAFDLIKRIRADGLGSSIHIQNKFDAIAMIQMYYMCNVQNPTSLHV